MTVRFRAVLIPGLAALTLAACETSYSIPFSNPFGSRASAPRPLPSAPTGTVGQSALPPPGSVAGDPLTASPGGEAHVAAVDGSAAPAPMTAPADGGTAIGRTDLLGGWTVASASDTCQLFMSLTTWSGGYRATTRGCGSETLQGVSAWNLEGQQVSLLNDSGSTVARLTAASKTQFNGQTTGGEAVSVSR
jgi:hypothetical protein